MPRAWDSGESFFVQVKNDESDVEGHARRVK